MKVQQVRLDGKGIRTERRPVPNVGNGVETFLAHPRPRNVHAIFWRQFLIAAEIDGRDRVLRPVTASPPRSGADAERSQQQRSRSRDVAFLDQLADSRARN